MLVSERMILPSKNFGSKIFILGIILLDTGYILAYSLILLNTDLHSPLNKRKITKFEFIRNSRSVQNCSELSEIYLGNLFDDILKDELKTSVSVKQAAVFGNLVGACHEFLNFY